MPSLLSVNVGLPRDVEWNGKVVHTAIWKSPVSRRVVARRLNLDGERRRRGDRIGGLSRDRLHVRDDTAPRGDSAPGSRHPRRGHAGVRASRFPPAQERLRPSSLSRKGRASKSQTPHKSPRLNSLPAPVDPPSTEIPPLADLPAERRDRYEVVVIPKHQR